jgi:4-hydroxy-2-oxoheptanedioate aldolase
MDGKELTEALHSGRRIFGTLVISTSPKWVEVMRGLDIDCVFIDTEHIPMDWNELGWMCHTYRALGFAPIVRIAKPDPFWACRVLDMGATGVVAAYIETAEQVKALRGAVKLRPLKCKRLDDLLSGRSKLEGDFAEYIRKFNEGHVLFVNIESVPGVEALDEILAVEDLDGILIGPHDLSCSLGVPEQYDHPLFDETVRKITEKARAKGIGVGIHNLPRVDQEIRVGKAGVNMILRLADMTLFARGLNEDLNKIRAGLGDKKAAGKLKDTVI